MPVSTRLKPKSANTSDTKDLDYWLDNISVAEVDQDHVDTNLQVTAKNLSGLLGWYYVANEEGACAYFGKEEDALRFRLAEINRRLNG